MSDVADFDHWLARIRPCIGPVVLERLRMDITPVELAARLCQVPGFAYLDGGDGALGEPMSVLAWRPRWTLQGWGKALRLRDHRDDRALDWEDDPLRVLDALSQRCTRAQPLYAHGAIGCVAFEALHDATHGRSPEGAVNVEGMDLPDLHLSFYESFLVFCHATRVWRLYITPLGDGLDSRRIVPEVDAEIAAALQREGTWPVVGGRGHWTCALPYASFLERVRAISDRLAEGEAEQIQFAVPFGVDLAGEPFAFYRALRRGVGGRYGAYLRVGDAHILCASPASLLRRCGKSLALMPFDDLRPRANDLRADEARDLAVWQCEREAGLLTGRVEEARRAMAQLCAPGTVQVASSRRLVKVACQSFIEAELSGKVTTRTGAGTILGAAFPSGAGCGLPREAALGIIAAEEGYRRHFYAGAVGWLGFNGDLAMNTALNLGVVQGQRLRFHADVTVRADTDEEEAYRECLARAVAWRIALGDM